MKIDQSRLSTLTVTKSVKKLTMCMYLIYAGTGAAAHRRGDARLRAGDAPARARRARPRAAAAPGLPLHPPDNPHKLPTYHTQTLHWDSRQTRRKPFGYAMDCSSCCIVVWLISGLPSYISNTVIYFYSEFWAKDVKKYRFSRKILYYIFGSELWI